MSRTSFGRLALAALAAAVVTTPRLARAHGVEVEVDRRQGAVAVRARYHGGRPLADARYVVQSPRGGDAPFAEGRTDRHGWLAFTPDAAGSWTVRIADATGHGKTVVVEVAEVVAPEAAAPAAGRAAAAGPPRPDPLPSQGGGGGEQERGAGRGEPERSAGSAGGGAGGAKAPAGASGEEAVGALRALAGAAAIAAIFVALFAVQRARRGKGR